MNLEKNITCANAIVLATMVMKSLIKCTASNNVLIICFHVEDTAAIVQIATTFPPPRLIFQRNKLKIEFKFKSPTKE